MPTDKFVFNGKVYEDQQPVLNQSNVLAGDGIEKSVSGDNVTIATEVPFSVVNGKVCVTFQKEESNG